MDQMSGPTTTADSQASGRLKVGAGSSYSSKKKNYVRAIVKKYKKDGKGGPGDPLASPGYGMPSPAVASSTPMSSSSVIPGSSPLPALSLSTKNTGFRMARPLKLKKMNTISSSLKGLKSKMKFGKVAKKNSLGF